jgi:hypothetical protein
LKAAFWVCAGFSAAVHTAIVAGWDEGRSSPAAAAPPATRIALRLLQPSGPAQPASPAPLAAPAAASAAAPAGPALAAAPTPGLVDSAAAPEAAPRPEAFLPRSQLSQPPQPLGELRLVYPDDAPDSGRYVLEITLYIGTDGQVRGVDLRSDDEPPAAVARAARAAFGAWRFQPGQLEGRPVPSRMRIEATYESVAAAAPPRRPARAFP